MFGAWLAVVGCRACVCGMGPRGFSCSGRPRSLRRPGRRAARSCVSSSGRFLRACRRVSVLCGPCLECGRVLLDVRMPEVLAPSNGVRHAPRRLSAVPQDNTQPGLKVLRRTTRIVKYVRLSGRMSRKRLRLWSFWNGAGQSELIVCTAPLVLMRARGR